MSIRAAHVIACADRRLRPLVRPEVADEGVISVGVARATLAILGDIEDALQVDLAAAAEPVRSRQTLVDADLTVARAESRAHLRHRRASVSIGVDLGSAAGCESEGEDRDASVHFLSVSPIPARGNCAQAQCRRRRKAAHHVER